ncbi:MAG TPA: DUF6498-containing protein [Dokdonella sp.]|uniref:DUF6498-containing protein n=1 Tax=Dokdonella sp. TaxID=2291710 RepID=UPI002B5CE83E|nr:DUF6498-containing protein [Dokdonella sp.]HUD41510.1 DUF6498-containing protein [Dokdonella sp.]
MSSAAPPRDHEYAGLLISNLLVLVLALWQDWPVSMLIWPFWLQSVVIGALHVQRMLALRDFSTEGLKANGRPVPETEAGKRSTAWFFAFHYGFFHAGYLVFLFTLAPVPPGEWRWVLIGGAAFAIGQLAEQRAVLARDARGRPNLGFLMFLPYLRVVPMHLAIAAGFSQSGRVALIGFVVLKTLADLGMAAAERRIEAGAAKKQTGAAAPVREPSD